MLTARTVRIWYRVHKWSSLICTAFILMACVTGLPLVFSDELNAVIGPSLTNVSVRSGGPTANLDRIVTVAQNRFPRLHPVALSWAENVPRISVYMSPSAKPKPDQIQSLLFDAHTGELVQAVTPKLKLTTFLLQLHSQIFLGLPGELLMGLAGVSFVLSLVSGTLIYGPFMRRLPFGTYRRTEAKRTRWFDLHNLLGIVTLSWGLVVGATGVMNAMSTPLLGLWYVKTLPKLVAPYRGSPIPNHLGSLDRAVGQVSVALPQMEVSAVLFPSEVFGSPRHYLILTKSKTLISTHPYQPAFVDVETDAMTIPNELPWYLRTLEISRPLHYGNYGGLPLKIIWALFDMVLIVILVSGVYLWLSKRRTHLEAELDRLVGVENRTLGVRAR